MALLASADVVLALHFGVVAEMPQDFSSSSSAATCRHRSPMPPASCPASERVIDAGPDLLAATLPVERIAARLLGLGYPCFTSDNAGTYLCNALLYHSLAAARALPIPRLAGLRARPDEPRRPRPVSARRSHPGCPLDWKTAVAGGLEIIAACLEYAGVPVPR